MKFLRILSLAILAFQIYIPWSVPHFVTQDGPSHVYTAFVTKDLVFHRHTSPYHALYFVQKFALPNWTGTLLLAGFLGLFGPDYAEAFVTSICLLGGYSALAYGAAAFAGTEVKPFLLGNWLVEQWFLWAGFYNFCLGIALLMLLVGYYARHRADLSWRRTAVLCGGLALLFFTHLIPAVLGGVALGVMGLWPGSARTKWGRLAVAIAPTVTLVLLYASRFRGAAFGRSEVGAALAHFPEKLFFFRGGWLGEQRYLWPVMLCLIVGAILLLRRAEWKSPRGALAVLTAASFLLYLVVPDLGFGGSVVKMRFAWAVFLFGALALYSAERLRRIQPWICVFVAVLLVGQLTVMTRQAKANSAAAGAYLDAMDRLPEGARFVRVRYPAPNAAREFTLEGMAFDPLLHLAALGAVRQHAVDLSDYQSATGTFSIAFKRAVMDEGQRGTLWGLESPEAGSWAGLEWVRGDLPVSIDYAVLFGEDLPDELEKHGTLKGTYESGSFVRIYELGRKRN